MNRIGTVLRSKVKYALLFALCCITGTGLELNAQESSSQIALATPGEDLPNAPSSGLPFQSGQSQSISQSSTNATPPPNPSYRPMKVREKLFLNDLIGPAASLVTGVQAGVDQGRTLKVPYPPDGFVGPGNHPAHGAIPEWGEGADGYAKRYASRFGQNLAGTTIKYGLGELLREDVTYHRCDCTGILPRVSHAFVGSLVAHTSSGKAVPSLPAIVSPFLASEIAVKAWYPARYNTSDALRTSANVYYTLPLKNLFYEFRRR